MHIIICLQFLYRLHVHEGNCLFLANGQVPMAHKNTLLDVKKKRRHTIL